jgi:hypothetical protein
MLTLEAARLDVTAFRIGWPHPTFLRTLSVDPTRLKNGPDSRRERENPASIYVEAARDQKPFAYVTGDPKQGLRALEECVIASMAIRAPEMAYLLAIQLLLIPWLRSQIRVTIR